MTATIPMKSNPLKSTRARRAAVSSGNSNLYSKNPIIDRFLQLTIEEGKSVRGVSLCYCTDSSLRIIFSLGDGSDQTLVSDYDSGSFMGFWRDASEFVKRLRGINLSPAI